MDRIISIRLNQLLTNFWGKVWDDRVRQH